MTKSKKTKSTAKKPTAKKPMKGLAKARTEPTLIGVLREALKDGGVTADKLVARAKRAGIKPNQYKHFKHSADHFFKNAVARLRRTGVKVVVRDGVATAKRAA